MVRRRLASMLLAAALAAPFGTACNPVDRSVRAWIESRTPDGRIVAGALVEIDGQPAGMTDARGLYRVKIRRRVGDRIALRVYDTAEAPVASEARANAGGKPAPTPHAWIGSFTVSSAGLPVETHGGRIIATLGAAPR